MRDTDDHGLSDFVEVRGFQLRDAAVSVTDLKDVDSDNDKEWRSFDLLGCRQAHIPARFTGAICGNPAPRYNEGRTHPSTFPLLQRQEPDTP